MATSTQSVRPVKANRSLQILHCCPMTRIVCFLVRDGKKEDRYIATEVECDFGRAFEVQKLGEGAETVETYHTNLGGGRYNSDTCDCLGGQKWGHCKHAEGLRALLAAGKLWEGRQC